MGGFLSISLKGKLIIGIIIAALWGGYWYMKTYSQLRQDVGQKESELTGLQTTVDTMKAKLSELESKKKIIPVLTGQLGEMLTKIPPTYEMSYVYDRVSALTKKVDVNLLSFSPGKREKGTYYEIVPVKLNLEGTFFQIMTFLDQMLKLNRVFAVGDITFGDSSYREGKYFSKVDVNLLSYKYDESATPTAQKALPKRPGGR